MDKKEIAYSALLVDDDAVILAVLQKALKQRGFMTFATQDPLASIEFVKSHRPSVACIDLDMPQMNGIEVIKKMREIVPDIRVVVVTGYLDTYHAEVDALKVRVVEKDSRGMRELDKVICAELELSREEYDALKTREKSDLKARMLFVGEEDDICDFMQHIAEEEGFQAQVAYSPGEALIQISSFRPDIVCTDLTMSQMHGDELIKKIRLGNYPSIKIFIGMTGDPDAHRRFLSVGTHEVLSKPFDLTTIINAMRRWALLLKN